MIVNVYTVALVGKGLNCERDFRLPLTNSTTIMLYSNQKKLICSAAPPEQLPFFYDNFLSVSELVARAYRKPR